MTLPKKSSRSITVGGCNYRWLVTVRDGMLHLVIESSDTHGQSLLAYFDAHDLYVRDAQGDWQFKSQQMAIRPSHVRRLIERSIEQGWQPNERGQKPFTIAEPEKLSEMPICSTQDGESQGAFLKKIAREHLWNLMFDICMDWGIRKRLEESDREVRIPISAGSAAQFDLSFAVFKDSYNADGCIIIGIESRDFPDIVEYYWWM